MTLGIFEKTVLADTMLSSAAEKIFSYGGPLAGLDAWTGVADYDTNDMAVATWFEENTETVTTKVKQLKSEAVSTSVSDMLRGDKESTLKGLKDILHMMPVEERESILKYLK